MDLHANFSQTYSQARQKFIVAAAQAGCSVVAYEHPSAIGAEGEVLAMDVASFIPEGAKQVVFVTSAMHGAEGFCGSGCQVTMLHDAALIEKFTKAKVGFVFLHAVNPYGFSHLRRTNEDNIDLNRNFVDYTQPLQVNEGYEEVHAFVVPSQWPPTPQIRSQVEGFIAKHGMSKLQEYVTVGQSKYKNGLFYSGTAPAWSNQILREILRVHIAPYRAAAWIDIHTGLGPSGHGEKICAGRNAPEELARARFCWGADVVSPYNGESASAAIRGPAGTAMPTECPDTVGAVMALEFGTVPVLEVLQALRADQWLQNAKDDGQVIDSAMSASIKQSVKDTFYTNTDTWRGAVTSQSRVAVLQALMSLQQGWE
jgi:Protein of unknown function (DUF2817)